MADYFKYLLAITTIKVQQKLSNPPTTPPPYIKSIPLSPKEILHTKSGYTHLREIFSQKCLTECIFLKDSPTALDSIYKLYECIMFGQLNSSKVEVKYFYSRSDWTLSTIPDPRDYANLERYTIITCIIYLLEYIFHKRKGLRTYNNNIPSSISRKDAAKMLEKERQMDRIPAWVEKMSLIKKPLVLSYSTENGRCSQICSGWLDKSRSSIFRKVAIRIMDPSRWQSYSPPNTLNPPYATELFLENGS